MMKFESVVLSFTLDISVEKVMSVTFYQNTLIEQTNSI